MKQLLIISTLLLLSSFVPPTEIPTQFNISETINTLEDMKEWMEWDVIEGHLDSAKAELYVENIDDCIRRLK